MTKPKITTLTPYFGSNRMLAHKVGELLRGCEWVGVGFAGGMSELLYIDSRTMVVNDVHLLQINLAHTVAHPKLGPKLIRRLRRKIFHPQEVADARETLTHFRGLNVGDEYGWEGGADEALIRFAETYFVATWMNRSALAGTKAELKGGLPLRWEAGGGDSAVRYYSAVESLKEWRKVLQRCNFSTLDIFEFLTKCQDKREHGIYIDPPFFGPGDKYKYTFTEAQHRGLADCLRDNYQHARIVCRFYDIPLIEELYPSSLWHWLHLEGRKQTNDKAPEVLISRNVPAEILRSAAA